MRKKINFNDNWYFHMGELEQPVEKVNAKTGTCGGASNLTEEEGFIFKLHPHMAALMRIENANSIYNVANKLGGKWDKVSIPHDWKIRQDYVRPEANDGKQRDIESGYMLDGVGYYRKKFSLSKEALGKRIIIEFEGVMRDSVVWVNGCYIGSHLSGYTGFSYDISEYLFYGDEGENVILVKTDTTIREGWWAEGGGVYRDIWMYELNAVHIKRHGTFVYCEDINDSTASVVIKTEVENKLDTDCSIIVRQKLVSQEEIVLNQQEKSLKIEAMDESNIVFDFILETPILWDVYNPYLYRMVTEIIKDGDLIDNYETVFGVRDIKYTEQGLFINGKPVEIKGVCEHQDFAGVGIALTKDIIDYKLKRIKEMGANAYRSAHHPATEYLLEACDRMGILVLNENRRFEVTSEGLSDLEELIKGSRNHPCIFMWSLENEEFITVLPSGKRILKTLINHAHRLDHTRLCTVAGNFTRRDEEYNSIPDVAGFNYDMGDANAMKEKCLGLKVIASEDSSYVSTRGVYEDNREMGLCDSYDGGSYMIKLMLEKIGKDISSGTLGGALAPGHLVYSWNNYENIAPSLGGLFVWTAFDYRGETFPWNWPTINSHYGAMDMCGFEKDSYYYWQSVWVDEPLVHMLPHWNWKGKEGQKIKIDVYSNCEEIELFVNNESKGREKHTKGAISSFEVEYLPGEVKVVAYNDGHIVSQDKKITAGEPYAIRLINVYSGKREQLIKAEIVDKSGIVCPDANNHIKFTIVNGKIIGVGNGNPSSHEPDIADNRKAFNGLAMVIVGNLSNNAAIRAEAIELKSAELQLINYI